MVGLWISLQRANRLQVENRQYREELGVLNIDDPTKVWARSLPTNSAQKWRWRIYAPKSRSYTLNIQSCNIGNTGWASGCGSSSGIVLGKGEHSFELELSKGESNLTLIHLSANTWRILSNQRSQRSQPGYEDWAFRIAFVNRICRYLRPPHTIRRGAIGTAAHSRDEDRWACGSSSTVPTPSPGLLVWLEPRIQCQLLQSTVPNLRHSQTNSSK